MSRESIYKGVLAFKLENTKYVIRYVKSNDELLAHLRAAEQGDILERWDRQIETPYADLTELEKQSDREQVDRYWHLIQAHTNAEIARTLDRLESEVQGIATSKPTVDYATSIPTNKVLYTIQAERAKLKEVK